MKKLFNFSLLSLLLIVFCLPLSAQDEEEANNNRARTISTSGSAEVRVVPSRVVLTFGVETFNPELAVAKRENDVKASGVLALAKEIGVAPKDVQTDYIFVAPIYENYDERRSKFLHYLVRKTVVVLLRDTTKFENILSGALERGATHVLRVRFEVDDLKKHRDKARSDAIKAARDKAQALAGDLGAKLGRVMNIQEYGSSDGTLNYGGSWQESYYGNGGGVGSQVSSQSDSPVSPTVGDALALGQMRISAQINVSFELQ